MKILLAHPGTQHSYKLAEVLYKKNLLFEFWSGFCLSSESKLVIFVQKWLPILFLKIQSRIVNIPPQYLKSVIISDVFFYFLSKISKKNEFNLNKRNILFQKLIPSASIKKSEIVIGFDTSSLLLIQRSKKYNKKFILDASIAHPLEKEKIFLTLAANFPDWADTILPKNKKLIHIEHQEYLQANFIVSASSFTINSLIKNNISGNKILLNPYGVDYKKFTPKLIGNSKNEKLKFIFVGTVGLRKGIPNLIQAWNKLNRNDATLTIIGPISENIKNKIFSENITVYGRMPLESIVQWMQKSDIFIFPSHFEGFGLVLLEALATGLPIIASTNTAAPDIIENGQEGFIIDPNHENELQEKMQYFIDNPEIIPEMSKKARIKAEQFTWEAYGNRWEEIIKQVTTC